MNVLTIRGFHRKKIVVDRYAGPVATVILSCAGEGGSYTLRLLLRDNLRTLDEVGGDELRIDDVADAEPGTLKLGGRYCLRLKIEKDSWVSFRLDDFRLLTSRGDEHVRDWVTTDHYLEAASREVDAERAARINDLMHDNELELALDELEGMGYESPRSVSYWESLRAAAENMGLETHAARYRHKLEAVNRRR